MGAKMGACYVTRRYSNLWELRQERFRDNPSHPYDICAVARTPEEMRFMLESVNWQGEVDWSETEAQDEMPKALG